MTGRINHVVSSVPCGWFRLDVGSWQGDNDKEIWDILDAEMIRFLEILRQVNEIPI